MKKFLIIMIILCVIGLGGWYIYITSTTYKLTVVSSDKDHGTVSGSKGRYDKGTEVLVFADAKDGHAFDCWTDQDGNIVSKSSSYFFKLDEDTKITANFVDGDSAPLNENGFSVVSVVGGEIEVNMENEYFSISHGKYESPGYWYLGEDDGYEEEKKYNLGAISFDRFHKDTEQGNHPSFRFHKGDGLIIAVFKDKAALRTFQEKPVRRHFSDMRDSGQVTLIDQISSESQASREKDFSASAGGIFTVIHVFTDTDGTEKLTLGSTQWFISVNVSIPQDFLIDNKVIQATYNIKLK